MKRLINLFAIYKGLKKEIYVLAFGRIVTSMGSMIWPMLTLILKSKLGYDASQIGIILMVCSLAAIPASLLGGKLADIFNKKNIIVCFDIFTVLCFITAGLIPLSNFSILIYFAGSIFQQMESPAYDSLVADLSSSDERERAYSLSYLAMNLGLVLSPTIGGMLFQDYLWLAFIISGISIGCSTLLIFFFVKDVKKEKTNEPINIYENGESGNVWQVLKSIRLLIAFFLIGSIGSVIYAQFNFLIPLHLESIFGEQGAFYFGILTSVNATMVIIFTPILTKLFSHIKDLDRLILGSFLEIAALGAYVFITDQFYLCIIAMIFFTFGEILCTLSNTPYLTKRIPATHRGRIMSISNNIQYVLGTVSNTGIGKLVMIWPMSQVWVFIVFLGGIELLSFSIYRKKDRERFSLLYT